MGNRTNSLGEWIGKYCADHDLTQAEFAFEAGVSSLAVANWIFANRKPRRDTIQHIAKTLRLNAVERAELWRCVGVGNDYSEKVARRPSVASEWNQLPSEKLPCSNELRQLPRWAAVAYAVRCAQRVFPLFERWDKEKKYSHDVAAAIRWATKLAKEGHLSKDPFATEESFYDSDRANNCIAAAKDAAEHADTYDARTAAQAAVHAARAAHAAQGGFDGTDKDAVDAAAIAADYSAFRNSSKNNHLFVRAARRDFGAFLSITKGIAWQPEYGMDPQSLSNLWIDGAPDWYFESELLKDILPGNDAGAVQIGIKSGSTSAAVVSALTDNFDLGLNGGKESSPALELYFERGPASKESFQRVLEALTKLHIAHGGSGLKFLPDDGFIHVREHVEA